jgi:hypothetical protein
MKESWNDWEIKGDLKKMSQGEQIASVFIPIFVSRIYRVRLSR